MDLAASPDLDAFYCYAIVFLLGLITAVVQINKRLLNYPGKWVTWHTWTLLSAYTFLPVVLFWFLDQVNAIHDTSFFAALVIGAGYQQVLSGNLATIRAGEVSKLWQPFNAWSDYTAERIRDQISTNAERFDERMRTMVLKDPQKQNSLHFVAITHAKDPAALQKQLDDIKLQEPTLGAEGTKLKIIAALYDSLKISSARHFEYLLFQSGVISTFVYHWYAKQWRTKITAILIAVVVLILVGWSWKVLSSPEALGHYYAWRLKKGNSTDPDRYRARHNLLKYAGSDPSPVIDLISALRYSSVTPKVADNIFEMVLESRKLPDLADRIPEALIDSLRTENAAIRMRTNEILLYLAQDKGVVVPEDLKSWKANEKETLNDIDVKIQHWKEVNWSPKKK